LPRVHVCVLLHLSASRPFHMATLDIHCHHIIDTSGFPTSNSHRPSTRHQHIASRLKPAQFAETLVALQQATTASAVNGSVTSFSGRRLIQPGSVLNAVGLVVNDNASIRQVVWGTRVYALQLVVLERYAQYKMKRVFLPRPQFACRCLERGCRTDGNGNCVPRSTSMADLPMLKETLAQSRKGSPRPKVGESEASSLVPG